MSQLRESFKGGKAVFTAPVFPIKCGGAPQKIMYLSEETFRKNGVRDETDIHYYTNPGVLFPPCPKYNDALVPIAAAKGVNFHK